MVVWEGTGVREIQRDWNSEILWNMSNLFVSKESGGMHI